jgi:hypothetical protein
MCMAAEQHSDNLSETKLYASRWLTGLKHEVYLNICNEEKRKRQPKLQVDGQGIYKARSYCNRMLQK